MTVAAALPAGGPAWSPALCAICIPHPASFGQRALSCVGPAAALGSVEPALRCAVARHKLLIWCTWMGGSFGGFLFFL